MSETTSPTPAAAEPGPTAGTSAGAPTDIVATPAASSPEPVVTETAPVVEAPVVEPVVETPVAPTTEERAPSLLSEAKAEDPAKPEVKAEDPKPVEAKVEPAKPLPAPTYEKFTLPEGVTVTEEKIGSFTGILGEYENKIAADPTQAHSVVQDLGQKLVDFYVGEMKEGAERNARLQRETWDRTIEGWRGEFRDDPDIGGNRSDTSLSRMGALLEMYGQKAGTERLSKLRDVFTATGAGDNPEVLRFVHWAASRLVETPRPVAAITPRAPVITSRAQRLYRNTPGAA